MAEEKIINNVIDLTDEELDRIVGGANVLFYETGTHAGFKGRDCHSTLLFSGDDALLKRLMGGGSLNPTDNVHISRKSISPQKLDDYIAKKKAAGYTIIAVDALPF